MPTLNSPTMTISGARPRAKPAVEDWTTKSSAKKLRTG